MSKISTVTASRQVFPGYVEGYEQEAGDWTVSMDHYFTDMDQAPFFEGAKDDMCQAHHLGYVIKGRFGIRSADGVEEVYEAGDAFVVEPGHTPFVFADSEFVAFTPTAEAKEEMAVMMPNVMRFAKEHGIELPEMTPTA